MTSILMHPAELAYAFSYARVEEVIGWGGDPFRPESDAEEDLRVWFEDGVARLTAAGRLSEGEAGATFAQDVTSVVLALADPSLVFMAERKDGDGLRRMTVHVADEAIVAMTRRPDGQFEVSLYADMTAAVVACTGYLGAAAEPVQAGARIDTTPEGAGEAHRLATSGASDAAIAYLVGLGASSADAASIEQTLAAPAAAGMLSVLYCAQNTTIAVEPYNVLTNATGETWILFSPGTVEGPMVFEQSSVTALTARVLVGVSARLRAVA